MSILRANARARSRRWLLAAGFVLGVYAAQGAGRDLVWPVVRSKALDRQGWCPCSQCRPQPRFQITPLGLGSWAYTRDWWARVAVTAGLCLGAGATMRWWFPVRHDRACPFCRYDLTGLPEPICPECGR